MIALGCNPEDPNCGFPELKDEDLWIWRQGYYGNMTPEEEADYVMDCE